MTSARSSGRLRILRRAGWWVLLIVVFLLPYVQWRYWGHATTTGALLALGYGRWRLALSERFGLPQGAGALLRTGATFVVLYSLFRFVAVGWIGRDAGLELLPWSSLYTATFACQALNEEIVLGALLLFGLERWIPHRILLTLVVSAVFSGLHFLLYRVGGMQHALLPATLLTLFAVGVLRAGSVLQARHIGYAWALHAGWNLVMFNGRWQDTESGGTLMEPAVFDALLGSRPLTLLSVIAAGMLLVVMSHTGKSRDLEVTKSEKHATSAPPQ